MISEARVISSTPLSKTDFLSMLNVVGKLFGIGALGVTQKIFDGESNVWIRQIDFEEAGYEDSDLEDIEALLLGRPASIIMIEYDEGVTAVDIVLKLVSEIFKRWPAVLDNCYDRVYRAEELAGLIENGKF